MFAAVFFLPLFLPIISKWKTQPPGVETPESDHAHLLKGFHVEPDHLSLLYFALSRK